MKTKQEIGQKAASKAAALLSAAVNEEGQATFIAATGASQFEFLAALRMDPRVDWPCTTMFHLDEFIGLPASHPASFRRFLQDRLIRHVRPGKVILIDGDTADIEGERQRLNRLISASPIDVAFVGIGENGHLAFNDPPADFTTDDPYIIAELDEACRRQQHNEGWFPTLEEVPRRAVSMSIRQILKSKHIICTVPDKRKAQAVYDCLTGPITPKHPASILRSHPNTTIYLDTESSAYLPANFRL